ncbi:MAG: TonB-dependent receptor [Thermoanaerobaculia bacterium]
MKSRGLGVFAALLLVTVALVSVPALAQQTGDIEGTVMDANNAPLPGVSVEVKSTSLLGVRSTVSDSAGRFRFPAVPPGSYVVTSALSGFTKSEKTVRVSLGATASVPMTLSLSGIKEELVITGEAPVVDTTRNVVGTSTSIDTIQKLPLGRNFTSIASTVAGTGNDGNVTVYGATGLENQYIIDGVNTTGIKIGDQGKNLNSEFVQEVEVKTGGYEAEYSHALGGVINVVTKSGGNEFHGDVFGYYDNESLAASDKRVQDRAIVSAGENFLPKRLDIGADLGGYFVKDRLWFFGAYDRVNRDQSTRAALSRTYLAVNADPRVNTVVTNFRSTLDTDETRTNLYSGKLTFRLGESNTFAVAAFGDPGKFTGDLSGVVGPDSARLGTQEFGGTDFSAKWDGIFGTKFLAQAQYGYHEDRADTTPISTAQAVRDRRRSLSTYAAGSGNPFYTNEQYKRNAVKVAGTGFFGANELKGGIDYESLSSSFNEQYGGGDFVTRFQSSGSGAFQFTSHRFFAKLPLNCNAVLNADGEVVPGNFGTPGAGNTSAGSVAECFGYTSQASVNNPPSTKNLGLFLQDSFKVMKNLTINAGIRYDNQKLNDAEGNTRIELKNEWSPRLGVVWDFMNNGKSKFSASYGRYYEVIPQDIQTRALGNEYTVFSYNYSESLSDRTTDPSGFAYAYIQGGSVIQPDLKGMYQDEVIANVEYEVAKGWSVGVKGIYKAIGRVVEDRCDLADARTHLDSFIPQGALTTCALINPGEGDSLLNNIKDPENAACVAPDGSITGNCESVHPRRYFRGLELDATHRFSNNFYMLASYLYSSLQGNYDGNQKQSTGQQDPNINADFDYLELIPNSFGRLALDHKHQFKMSATYSFPFGVTVGGAFRYSSGSPYYVTGYARAGYTTEKFLLPGRGENGSLPAVTEMDLHLEYSLRLGTVSITPIVDVFNLLNRQGVTGRSTVFNSRSLAGNNPNNNTAAVVNARNDQAGCLANPSVTNYACSTNANFGRDTAWQDPRLIRISARISF